MIYDKRYLQFNDLVIDGYDMISDFNEDTSFKESAQVYSYGHGSYMPYRSDFLFSEQKSASMTLMFRMQKLPCEFRKWYLPFAETELSRPGRLWAVKNNEIIWTFAHAKNITPINNGRADIAEWDVEFTIPGGIWHKADLYKTFCLPYDICTLMECKGYQDIPCGDCCDCPPDDESDCYCCCTDDICPEMALCYHRDRLQDFYECDTPYQFAYDCQLAERFNRDGITGLRLCTKQVCNDGIIAGRFYSNTDITTDLVTVTVLGKMHNPQIEINGNVNIIQGDYDGFLRVTESGDIYYRCGECADWELISPDRLTIPKGNVFGWTVRPRSNSIVVRLNTCNTRKACVYIDVDALTL